ncbi:MAG: hypothetical protein LBQ87_09460 [Candidatus Fibromonas sp.]|jgi:hypothetical protein|nr:hypothetical protein [Candidatus Fibromonas sp.]
MKLSVFFSTGAILFANLFWGCSDDLSVNKAQALEVELPDDFSWEEYASINKDIPGSQIAFDIQKKLTAYSEFKTDSLKKLIEDCLAILGDLDFAGKIYMEYASCPKAGWDQNSACTGVYANNPNYTVVKGQDSTCNIGTCWAGGWDEPYDCGNDICPGTKEPFKEALEYKIATYNTSGISRPNTFFTTEREINMLCRFVMPRANNSTEAENYLKAFYSYSPASASPVFGSSIDPILIKQHYFLVGRSEGRPYKYCKPGAYDPAKTRETNLALEFRTSQGHTFYDYGQNLFCLNECENKTECDDKIYLLRKK